MASRYFTVVGILGEPNSGKTACLASLYLLAANASLQDWKYADSKSLMGLEDIARGARVWNGGSPPLQMTQHTEVSDDRRAGFLHLRLASERSGSKVDLALPDLPGEWTTKLITHGQSDRFEFLKRADVLWIVVDGRVLMDPERRQGAITRLGQLAGRIDALFEGRPPRALVVVTRRDMHEIDSAVGERLLGEIRRKGVDARLVPVAPFSETPNVRAGFGLTELVALTTGDDAGRPGFWPDAAADESSRSYLQYRRGT